ncbi:hypothetical protein BT96DRAFT_810340 [Gymnopus androsaceus JB14]|uniref:DNA breaking-rejoining enzyme n=1 Tax=Gymnopus androsaceus JB14 TaxID=1447944 RepID=A0A6A4ICR0_9AGAR|nr:hypothetical protein BT96DRAFT_810340 [Gymnopus androsaceus JB14]
MISPFLFIYDAPPDASTQSAVFQPAVFPLPNRLGTQWIDPNALIAHDLGIKSQFTPTAILQPLVLDTRPLSNTPSSSLPNTLHDVRAAAARTLPQKTARRSSQKNYLAPSPFRPANVPADRRVLLWTTPYSLHSQAVHDNEISHCLQVKMFEGLLIATTDDTRQAYGAGLLRFNQFCDAESIPEALRMPASSILLGAFVADHMGTCSGKCIQNWLSGLRLWHLYNAAEWHGKEGWLPSLKKAAEKKGVSFKRPMRGPVERAHMLTLRSHLDLSIPRDASKWAAATTAYWGCRRLGEVLPKSANKVAAEHDVFRSTRVTRSEIEGRRVISFHLPWTKTTGVRGGECYLTEIPGDPLCPVAALENHLKINHTPPPSTPFFAFQENGSWTTLIKSNFLTWTSSIFREHNLEHVFGHSFRIGGSLAYLLLGVEPKVIMKIGGWTSLCFLIYWRRLEQVIPLAVARAMHMESHMRAFASSHSLPFTAEDLDFNLSND